MELKLNAYYELFSCCHSIIAVSFQWDRFVSMDRFDRFDRFHGLLPRFDNHVALFVLFILDCLSKEGPVANFKAGDGLLKGF